MSTSPASLISAESSPHLIPTADIIANERPPETDFPDWNIFLNQKAQRIDNENQAEEMERNRKIVRNRNYYRGKQTGYISVMTGQYVDLPDGDILYTKNYVRALTLKRTAVWSKSRTEFRVRARGDSQEARDGARMGDKLADYYEEVLFPESIRQREGKFVTLSGESYRYYYWSADAGRLIDVPIYATQQIKIGTDTYSCFRCETSGPATPDMWGCPMCGNEAISLQPAQEVSAQVIVGTRKVREGDLVLEIVDPLEIKTDLHSRDIDGSPYLRRRRLVRIEVMKAKFPRFQIQSGGPFSEEMHFQSQLETSAGNISGTIQGSVYNSTGSYRDMVQFDQYWLDPVEYAEYWYPRDTPIGLHGKVIPRGTKAIDIFPDGCYFARGGRVIIDERPENKKDHWSHLRDDLIAEAAHGDSRIDDVIELQDLLNDVHSLRFEYLMRCTVPPLLYDKRLTQGSQLVNRPGENVPIQNRIPGERIEDGIYQIPTHPLDQHIDLFIDSTQRDMVEFIGAYSDQAAAPELKQGTATAASLAHDQSTGLVGVPLALKAEADIRTFDALLRLCQKHWDGPRYLPLLGSHSMIEGDMFDAAKLPDDFMLVLADQSWLPRNATEDRNDLLASFQISPALPLGPFTQGLPPFLARHICETFNQPFDEDTQAATTRLATYKLNKIIDMAEAVEQQGMAEGADPAMLIQMVLMQVPINPRTDPAEVTIRVATDWLMTDKGIKSSPFVQQVINARMDQAEESGVMQARKQQMLMMASNPMAAAQAGAPGQGGPPQGAPQSQGGK